MTNPTQKQIAALYHVECFTGVHGRPPSFRELARLLGVQVWAAQSRVLYATKKGLLVHDAVNGLTLTDTGRACVQPLLGG